MIQDIAPHRLYNHYDPSFCPSAESFVMVFRKDGEVLLSDRSCSGQVVYPRVKELFGEDVPNLRYLFSIDEDRYFLYPADGAAADTEDGPAVDGSGREAEGRLRIPDGFVYRNIRSLRRMDLTPREAIFAASMISSSVRSGGIMVCMVGILRLCLREQMMMRYAICTR